MSVDSVGNDGDDLGSLDKALCFRQCGDWPDWMVITCSAMITARMRSWTANMKGFNTSLELQSRYSDNTTPKKCWIQKCWIQHKVPGKSDWSYHVLDPEVCAGSSTGTAGSYFWHQQNTCWIQHCRIQQTTLLDAGSSTKDAYCHTGTARRMPSVVPERHEGCLVPYRYGTKDAQCHTSTARGMLSSHDSAARQFKFSKYSQCSTHEHVHGPVARGGSCRIAESMLFYHGITGPHRLRHRNVFQWTRCPCISTNVHFRLKWAVI